MSSLVKRDSSGCGNLATMNPTFQSGNMSGATPPEDQTPVPSPCINVCQMSPETGLCLGCMRTIDEIVAWGTAGDDVKRAVWREIHRREAQIEF